uniref:Uncharacterized protein n=1 Tax=Trichobilharzia regenti TaxID=157069 RepID=A0AA85K4C8_TRIRE|nr:unnamed protein product [Trichobilharzia regenti]
MAIISLNATKSSSTGDNIPSYVSSDDATSCYIVILRSANRCCIGHLDTAMRVKSFFKNTEQFFFSNDNVTTAKVHIIGGFPDPQNLYRSILHEILLSLVCNDRTYELGVCCIAENNIKTATQNTYPAIMGVLYDIIPDRLNPACIGWKARGPVPALRLSRLYSPYSGEITNVFDPENCILFVNPFAYVRPSSVSLNMSTEQMRARSTTPDQEPPTFFEGQAAINRLMFFCHNSLTWFKNGPLKFQCTADSSKPWVPLDEASAVASRDSLTNISI